MTGLQAYVRLKVQIELNLISSLFFIVVNDPCMVRGPKGMHYTPCCGVVFISFVNLIISDKCVHITIGTIVAGNKTKGK